MLSNEELQEMKEILEQEVIDDAEELLNWFGMHGSELISEVLEARRARSQTKEGKPTSHK